MNLEDTLRKISEKLNLKAQFLLNGKDLGIDETFIELHVLNDDTIIYDLSVTP